MVEALTYYAYNYHKQLTQWFIREQIGSALRKRYQVPKELPPNLFALVRKLEAVKGTVENNQLRVADYARSSGIKAFPDWFVHT